MLAAVSGLAVAVGSTFGVAALLVSLGVAESATAVSSGVGAASAGALSSAY